MYVSLGVRPYVVHAYVRACMRECANDLIVHLTLSDWSLGTDRSLLRDQTVDRAEAVFNAYVSAHPSLRSAGPPYAIPLVNFTRFLILTLRR